MTGPTGRSNVVADEEEAEALEQGEDVVEELYLLRRTVAVAEAADLVHAGAWVRVSHE